MGTVSRVHTFASGAILTAAQLNNEFDNLLTSSAINGGLDATNLGVTAGQATASKALVVDASRNLADATGSNRINNLALSGTFESTGAITASAGITSGGNIVSDTDSTDDLGTTGVRWANLFVDDVTVTNNVTIGGTLTLTGGITLNGNTTIGDSSADTLTVNSTITSNLLFTDATYDIGASGATRPRDLYLSGNGVVGGTLGVTGATTLSSTLGVTGALTATAGITSGSNIVSDSDSTDDLGTTSVRWANLYVDSIGDTGQALAITAGSNNVNVTAGTLALTGAQTISSTLGVTGLITASGGLSGTTGTFSGNVTISKDAPQLIMTDSGVGGGTSDIIIDAIGSNHGFYFRADGATNHVILESNGDFKVDADTLFVDASADRIGIGTSSPTRLLSLYSNSPTSVFQSFTNSSTGNTASDGAQIGIDSNNDLQIGQLESGKLIEFYNNGSLAMVIDSSQRIGIGTSSPSVPLHIQKSLTSDLAKFEDTGTDSNPNIQITNDARSYQLQTVGARSDAFEIWDRTAGATRLAIDTSGNMGLGGTAVSNGTGSTVFNVNATTGGATIHLTNNTTGTTNSDGALFVQSGSDLLLINRESGNLKLRTADTDRLTIDSSGGVGVGVAPYANYRFSVKSAGTSSATYALQIEDSLAYSLLNARSDGRIVTGTRSNSPYNNTTASAANMYVDSSGILYRSTSSAKYKTGVETIEDSYADAILNMRPVWYRSLSEADNADHGWWGFIAEEVAEIDPRLVQYRTTESVISEESGKEETVTLDEPIPEGVSYDRFVPLLLNLIQRQQQSIATLENKVAALEAA